MGTDVGVLVGVLVGAWVGWVDVEILDEIAVGTGVCFDTRYLEEKVCVTLDGAMSPWVMLLKSLPVVFWEETDRPLLRCHLAWGDLQRDHVDITTPILLLARLVV